MNNSNSQVIYFRTTGNHVELSTDDDNWISYFTLQTIVTSAADLKLFNKQISRISYNHSINLQGNFCLNNLENIYDF